MSNDMRLNKEWSTRPDDQRFLSMKALHEYNLQKKEKSLERVLDLRAMELSAKDGEVSIQDKAKKVPTRLNNWAFGQLCSRAHAPASYLRSLPAEVAIVPLQHSLGRAEENNSKTLLRNDGKAWSASCFTSPTYGRIYDADASGAVLEHMDLGVWKVPSASYAKTDPKKATTLYASDRDVFICLVDDSHPIDIPGKSALYKGLIIGNSEVGAGAFFLTLFYYNRICDNRIIWGFDLALDLRIRHSSGGPRRYMAEAKPALQKYLEAKVSPVAAAVKAARALEVAKTDEDTYAWVQARGFSPKQAQEAFRIASEEPGLNPRSLWGVVQGLTGHAHSMKWNDDRLDLEKRASSLLKQVEVKA